jgi:hypothetical protein
MSHKPRKRRIAVETLQPSWRFPVLVPVVFFLLIGVTVTVIVLSSRSQKIAVPLQQISTQPSIQPPLKKFSCKIKSFAELISLPLEQIDGVDIAAMNLLCAEGLPGAQEIDIDRCLAKLDEWAVRVQSETQRHLYRVTDSRFAEHYHHSENYYRAEMLLQVLQEDCGVKYNPERIRNVDFTNSKDLFIHGMIGDTNGGTCASMPVLYVAIGRRLGYPLSLVPTKGHLFVRWDDGKARFNIEGSGDGFSSHPDEYYHFWPLQLDENEKKSGNFLISLTHPQELAAFLAARGHCLFDIDDRSNAHIAYQNASKFDPNNSIYLKWQAQTAQSLRLPLGKHNR